MSLCDFGWINPLLLGMWGEIPNLTGLLLLPFGFLPFKSFVKTWILITKGGTDVSTTFTGTPEGKDRL